MAKRREDSHLLKHGIFEPGVVGVEISLLRRGCLVEAGGAGGALVRWRLAVRVHRGRLPVVARRAEQRLLAAGHERGLRGAQPLQRLKRGSVHRRLSKQAAARRRQRPRTRWCRAGARADVELRGRSL